MILPSCRDLLSAMSERFSYGTLGAEQTGAVLSAYEQTRSCKRTSLQEGVYVSSATVSRVIQEAVVRGHLDPQIKRGTGRPADLRKHAMRAIEEFPSGFGFTRSEQAAAAGCSVDTIYEALKQM